MENIEIKLKNGTILSIVEGSITNLSDKIAAIVCPSNNELKVGNGADFWINKAAGPEYTKNLEELSKNGGCATGEIKTIGLSKNNLFRKEKGVQYIIETVAPKYKEMPNADASELLSFCYLKPLQKAENLGLDSIAFPAVGTGEYAYPKNEAPIVIYNVMKNFNFSNVKKVTLVYFSPDEKKIVDTEFKKLTK